LGGNFLKAPEMSEPQPDTLGGVEAGSVCPPEAHNFAKLGLNPQLISFLLAVVLCTASVWFYADRILVAHQINDAVAHDRPRGNLSDLYPRWLGARELLLHHRNPYGDDITVEIQKGYYGRAIDPAKPNDPKDREGFAYPVFVVFLLAPLIWLPFHTAQLFFYWLLVLATGASVWLWLRTLRWSLPYLAILGACALALGNIPAVQGIKIQQLSLLLAGLMALAIFSLSEGQLFIAGVLVALTTIKPQLAWALVAALLGWAISDWRKRRGFVAGFLSTMVTLLVGAEIVLPGWWKFFLEAIGQYHQYTQNRSVIEVTVSEILSINGGAIAHRTAQALSFLVVVACAMVAWKWRKVDATVSGFGGAIAFILALTVLVVPMYAPYNQVLLLPAVVVLWKERKEFLAQARWRRTAFCLGLAILAWQWIASVGLLLLYFSTSRERALDGWSWPFYSTFALPVWTFGLILAHLRTKKAGF
jgi:hypothetical protein